MSRIKVNSTASVAMRLGDIVISSEALQLLQGSFGAAWHVELRSALGSYRSGLWSTLGQKTFSFKEFKKIISLMKQGDQISTEFEFLDGSKKSVLFTTIPDRSRTLVCTQNENAADLISQGNAVLWPENRVVLNTVKLLDMRLGIIPLDPDPLAVGGRPAGPPIPVVAPESGFSFQP